MLSLTEREMQVIQDRVEKRMNDRWRYFSDIFSEEEIQQLQKACQNNIGKRLNKTE